MRVMGGEGVANARFSPTLQLIIRLHLIIVTGAGRGVRKFTVV